jgi:transcription elongation GreA/GreB family factor
MEKIAFKKAVLTAAKAKQAQIIDDFKVRINDLNDIEHVEDEDQHDLDQQAANQSSKEMVAILTKELRFAEEEMNLLQRMLVPDHAVDEVVLGAIVETDAYIFYPSVSLERFEAAGKQLFGLSKKAPLFAEMKGKKKGETFSYNGINYTINAVY